MHFLNLFIICDENGNELPPNSPPPPIQTHITTLRTGSPMIHVSNSSWQISFTDVAKCLRATLTYYSALWTLYFHLMVTLHLSNMHEKIDAMTVGEAPWEHFILKYSGPLPKGVSEANIPTWMTNENDVWFHNPVTLLENLLANPDFEDEFDFTPYQECTEDGSHCYCDFMSGNWSWQQVVCLFI